MDVRLRFALAEREYDERTCIIVVRVDTTAIGLVVDKVNEVIDITRHRIEHMNQKKNHLTANDLSGEWENLIQEWR